MNAKRIYLSNPHIGHLEQEYVAEAFATNWIAPLGPHVDAFERELAQAVGTAGAVALSSGTAAIHLALRLAGVGRGDTVFCSTLTFVASANPILYEGAVPVFIDSEPDSWNMSPAALQRAFIDAELQGRLPKAVVVVHLYGQSADMAPILELCGLYGVPVIEDAAESLGATYRQRPSGTFGRFGVYSFNGNKMITTSGGGAIVSDDLEALDKARFWSTQSREPVPHYEHTQIGFNYRMSNVAAAIGRGQLRVLEERVESRRRVYDRYFRALSRLDGIAFMPEAPYGRSTRWLTALTVDAERTGWNRSRLLEELAGRNIEARPVWKPMHLQPLFQSCSYYPHEQHRSVSDELFGSGICLPSGSDLQEEDQNRVIDAIMTLVSSVAGKRVLQ
ncbi:DegT/DnrJ/EryC1/StrS aminotransferase family protein [Paenibacillus sp. MSJ-34]|uniref:DegT/DnrJ/EryC1/StrS family aminotransferase n=1 Tax=Paenibacillus sp. MSJ-34 TaxID=2841529 RepID=UPI001C0F745A|nr:aminotransferase class I/II-fold pyridoxal phosphate-dependent enzyme [Paenibacillus sp. MSJ-34]MBU5443464.1 aminotransferase class I/II-fold pyridoxal phosphate-dependent enzyme [Paenibacillus sp. MSJ-34]